MMKNLMMRILVVLMMIFALTLFSNAQSNNKRIQFAKGKKSTVEKITLAANDGITYVFGAKEFNLLNFRITGSYTDGADAQGLTIKLTKLGKKKVLAEASPGEDIEHQIQTGNGDYVITVMNPGTRKAKITLNFSINK